MGCSGVFGFRAGRDKPGRNHQTTRKQTPNDRTASPHPSPPHASRFFSTLFMRAAKMSRARGGGSMTLLPLVPGRPATGGGGEVVG